MQETHKESKLAELNPKIRKVFEVIESSKSPPGAYDLLNNRILRANGFKAPTQIYRALKQLLDLKLIHKVESLNTFIACCSEHEKGPSILAICDSCGQVQDIPAEDLAAQVEKEVGKKFPGSKELKIELKGVCEECISQGSKMHAATLSQ